MFSVLSYGSFLALGSCVAAAYGLGHWVQSKRERRVSQERVERFGRAAQEALWECWSDTGAAQYSSRFCELIGLKSAPEGATDAFLLERLHPSEREAFRKQLSEVATGEREKLELEHRLRSVDGSFFWVETRIARVAVDGRILLTAWVRDIRKRKINEQELRFHAFRDSLTGLANRSLFTDRLSQSLLRVREANIKTSAVLLIDLDRFKLVNDSLSHSAGDALLHVVAERLSGCIRDEDTVARLGGDEFAVLLNEIESAEDAVDVAVRARAALMQPIVVQGRPVTVGASIGIVVVGDSYSSAADVIRDADTAMYRAKAKGRGQWALFDASMRVQAVERLTLENELRSGLASGEFEVYFQPMVDTAGMLVGVEALPRWHHPRHGTLLPKEFIELAEETGLIMDLGDLVLSHACELGRRMNKIARHAPWTININLSPRQLQRSDLARRIEMVLDGSGLDPSRLCIEVTEDLILEQPAVGAALFTHLRERGVKLCMDDFGTGYSSLSYVHRFRFDYLKIETAFVHGIETAEGGTQLVRSMINLARNLGVTAVAEGVETQKQWDVLKSLGCPQAQGFYFSKPLAASEFLSWMRERFAACA